MYCCRWDIRRSHWCHRWLGPNWQRYSGTRGLTVCNRANSRQRILQSNLGTQSPTVEPLSAPHSWQPGVHRSGQCRNLWGKLVSIIRGHACCVSSSCSTMTTAISNCTDLDPQVTTILLSVCQDSTVQHTKITFYPVYNAQYVTSYDTK